MNKNKVKKARFVSWESHRRKLMKDPAVAKAYRNLQPEWEIIRKITEARIKKGITQKKLAEKMKTRQAAISRLETGNANPSLQFLKRLAQALDSRLEIRLLPR